MAVHIQVGKEKRVAVVFSCPGRLEKKAGYPAAGTTGNNLKKLLSLLSLKMKRDDLVRDNITITNAWPKIEFIAETQRSEAKDQEINAPLNIKRLQQELDDITEFIIFCGNKAKVASDSLSLKNKPKFIFLKHLGTRGLLSIHSDVKKEPIISAKAQILAGRSMSMRKIQLENTKKRLEIVANCLINQLKL